MRYFNAVNGELKLPQIALGVMRLPEKSQEEANALVDKALDLGINMFDTADIYANGESDRVLGKALEGHNREDIIIQSKASIIPGKSYDASYEHIVNSVESSLDRLGTDYLDILLLHRPDALMEIDQVAAAFIKLHREGKVRYFGVSNFNSYMIEVLNRQLPDKLRINFNQVQFSLSHNNLVASGLNVNRNVPASIDPAAGLISYSRLNKIRLQAWSPFQKTEGGGTFINDSAYKELNDKLEELAEKYNTNVNAIAVAWILRLPVGIQTIVGTTNIKRLEQIAEATNFTLSHADWYELYRASGKPLP